MELVLKWLVHTILGSRQLQYKKKLAVGNSFTVQLRVKASIHGSGLKAEENICVSISNHGTTYNIVFVNKSKKVNMG